MTDILVNFEKEFEELKLKHLREFNERTPKGNTIQGLICTKSNHLLGSLRIDRVNGKEVTQYVRGFPKIHYEDEYHTFQRSGEAYEKLDGTNIAVYSLRNKKGEIIEIVPKSRNRPILDDHFQKMYDLCDTKKIKDCLKNTDAKDMVLFFEMYGMKNRHFIQHMDTYIDLKMIGMYFDNHFKRHMNGFVGRLPKQIFDFFYDDEREHYFLNLSLSSEFHEYTEFKCSIIKDKSEIIPKIKEVLEEINKNYLKENGRYALEGVVINSFDENNNQIYIKVKPQDLEEKSRAEGKKGVPKKYIKKEVFKFFDEYASDAKKIYLNDLNFIIAFVKDNLREEFSDLEVDYPNMENKIEQVFIEVAKSRTVSDSINNIANKLVSENPELDVPNLMRKFAKDYPFLKKSDSSDMFNLLSRLKNKSG